MRDISWEILEKYQVRKTRKQKTAFINFLKDKIPELKVEKSKIIKSRNIIVGDVEKAEVVLGAHYDTCAKLPFPNFLTPKNLFMYLLYSFLVCLGVGAACVLILFICCFFTRDVEVAKNIFSAFLWAILLLMMFGPANKQNANDNTSGVITLLEIMGKLDEKQKEKVAFVFFDHEEIGLLGSAFFALKHGKEMRKKLLINFDCVADGDNIMIIHNRQARLKYGTKFYNAFENDSSKRIIFDRASRVIYPSDQANFPCSIGVAAFKKNKLFGLYIDKIHTKNDVNFDEKNIDCISTGVLNFINTF